MFIENFKGFSEKNEEEKKENSIKIKPITLIYGPNSFGKSSILQSLLLLNQTVNDGNGYEEICLVPTGNIVKLGKFEDYINNNDTTKELKIELTLPFKNYDIKTEDLAEVSVCYNYSLVKQVVLSKIAIYKKEININETSLSNPQKQLIRELHVSDNNVNEYDQVMILPGGRIKKEIKCSKKSFLKIKNFKHSCYDEKIFDYIEDTIKRLIYISSFRNPPERYYVPEDNRRTYVGKNGEYTAEILKNDSTVYKSVNFWLKRIAGYELSLKTKNKKVDSVNLNDNVTDVKNINLIDLGSGIAQVLPIITQAFRSENDMILIEEPEIHLHPKAQAELGAMFADAAKEKNNTFIIETHSENLMLRLGRLIRTGKLSKDDVSIIYVDKNANGSRCIPLELDDDGDIININEVPGGFFDEGFNELFDLTNKE